MSDPRRKQVVVLYCYDPAGMRAILEGVGLHMAEEQHGNGPKHYSVESSTHVLEIYPMRLNAEYDPKKQPLGHIVGVWD